MKFRTYHLLVITTAFVLLLISPVLADTVSAKGEIVSIDEASRTITVKRKTSKGEKTGSFVIGKKAAISIGDEFADFDELESGQTVSMTYDTQAKEVVVIKVESTSAAQRTSDPAPTTTPDAQPKRKLTEGTISLFNGTDLSGWTIEKPPEKTYDEWSVDAKDHLLKCTPRNGKRQMDYIKTEEQFDNFKLSIDYRYPPGGLSTESGGGVVVRSPGKHSNPALPRGIEIQICSGTTGDFWAAGSPLTTGKGKASGENPKLLERTKSNEKPVGEWNHLEITCQDDQITVVLNDKQVNKGRGARVIKGYICLWNQGTTLEYKNIEVTPIKK